VLSSRILEVLLSLRFFIYQYGLVYHLNISQDNKNFLVYLLSWVVIIAIIGLVKVPASSPKTILSRFMLLRFIILMMISFSNYNILMFI